MQARLWRHALLELRHSYNVVGHHRQEREVSYALHRKAPSGRSFPNSPTRTACRADARWQSRNVQLLATPWVRHVSRGQTFISLYLMFLWGLATFG